MINIDVKLELVDVIRQYSFRVGTIDSFKTFYILKTDRGTKILNVWNDIHQLEQVHYHQELLISKGFRKIDRFIRTKDKKPYVIYRGIGYSLSDVIKGISPSIKLENDLELVGKTLGALHSALKAIKVYKPFIKWSYHFEKGYHSLGELQTKLKIKQHKTQIDQLVLADIPSYKDQIKQSIQMADKVEKNMIKNRLEPIWCHGNLTLNSFKIDDFGQGWIIDYQTPIVEVASYDVAKLISRLYLKNGYDFKPIALILNNYHEIKPLSTDDKLWILTYVAYPHGLWKLYQLYRLGKIESEIESIEQYHRLIEEQISLGKLYQELFTYFRI